MMKQVKLLSLVAILTSGVVAQGAMDPVDCLRNLSKRSNTLATYAAAMILGNVAYSLSQREFDDKGTYRTVGDSDIDPVTADLSYCLAMGTGITAIENTLTGTADLTIRGSVEQSLTNAVCCFLTNLVSAQDAYKSLDRNHVLLRGWLPGSTKIDDTAKKALVFAVTRSLINRAKAAVNVPSVATCAK